MSIKEQKNKILLFFLVALLGLFVLGVSDVSAATLKITASNKNLSIGDTATLWIAVNTEGVAINNAEAVIQYPTDLVEILSVSRGSSIFSLWVEEPTFSNSTGIVSFNGGKPTPGYTGSSGNIISVTVRAKKAGQATFSYSGAAVRADDGLGTNVLSSQSGITLTVAPKEEKTETQAPQEEEPTPKEETKKSASSLKISSPTHPNQELWYKERDAIFQWVVPAGVDTVQTAIDDNNSGNPRVVYRPPINIKEVEITNDGVWYFKVRARKNSVWGPVSTYLVRVDTTPPEKKNDVDFSYDENSRILNIIADIQDKVSGIDYYEIYINDILVETVQAKEFINSKYSINISSSGSNTVKLKVFDRAGNNVEATGTFRSKGLPRLELEPIPGQVSVGEQLLIKGTSQFPNTDVTINIKHDNGETTSIKTQSNSEGIFFVLTSAIEAGSYEVWAQSGLGGQKVTSKHLFTNADNRFILIVGLYNISGLPLIALALTLLIILILLSGYFGYRLAKLKPKRTIKNALNKQDHTKSLSILKRRLERHLQIIQNTRQKRVLTDEEKRIKDDIENDLDEIDKELGKYDKKK